MKTNILAMVLLSVFISFNSCKKEEEDEGKLPDIAFKKGSNYASENQSLAAGTSVLVGINASKTEDKDVLKRFDISLAENGGDSKSIYNRTLSGSEVNTFSYDTLITLDTIVGVVSEYTFSVTNRDGLSNRVSIEFKTE